MSQSVVLTGAQCKVYFGGKLVNSLQSINYSINYGKEAIYGIDSAFPQEISTGKVSVTGGGSIVYVQAAGGLQGKDMIGMIQEVLYTPYISLRIQDRKNKIDLFFCPQVQVSQESLSVSAKGKVMITFSFIGIIPYGANDLA